MAKTTLYIVFRRYNECSGLGKFESDFAQFAVRGIFRYKNSRFTLNYGFSARIPHIDHHPRMGFIRINQVHLDFQFIAAQRLNQNFVEQTFVLPSVIGAKCSRHFGSADGFAFIV